MPRGVVAIDFNVPGGESAPGNAVATLIDSRRPGDRRATGVGVIADPARHASGCGTALHGAATISDRRSSPTARTTATATRCFYFGLNWEVWLIIIIKCLVAFVALLVATALMIWFERKVISDMQSRIGPNRAGPWGLLQTLADGTKLVLQGGPAARPGGRLRLQAGPVPLGDPGRARSSPWSRWAA